ncbi:MAG TPA: SRPBCC family protein [Caulobacteraceae bacterium]|nr:SRPBCC family protein [Caulobacteraceae bacterium]
MTDRIEKTVELNASPARVWKAISDYREFGAWFGVALEGPFEPGREARGKITEPGYERFPWRAMVQKIQPQQLFSFTWHPFAVDPEHDYSGETPTLVEFRIEPTVGGTRLTITESGFDKVPAARRGEAFLRNDEGWTIQAGRIAAHVDGALAKA